MSIAERKEKEKAELRELIANAALSLFIENGFEKTSIRNIADKIEYSPATIYLYFKDKNELFLGLQTKAFKQFAKYLLELDSQASAEVVLYEMGKNYFRFAVENPELYELMFTLNAPMEALECKEAEWDDGVNAFGLLVAQVVACQNQGFFRGLNPQDISLSIWSFMHGLITLKIKNRLNFLDERPEDSQIRMMRAFEIFHHQLIKYETN